MVDGLLIRDPLSELLEVGEGQHSRVLARRVEKFLLRAEQRGGSLQKQLVHLFSLSPLYF